jgi:cytochrome c peroxidase
MSKNLKRMSLLAAIAVMVIALLVVGQGMAQTALTEQEELGSFLYFDTNLSEPDGQSCASCHDPAFGFVDPNKGLPVSAGVIPGLFGGRNSPSSAYAMYAPAFHFDEVEGLWIGGQFWDGRATGDVRGDPLADQALGPFLNPVEMANPSKDTVVWDALNGAYGDLFVQVCGEVDFEDPEAVNAAYNCIADSIATFERTGLFGQFSSKYDYYLQACLAAHGRMDNCAKGIGRKAEMVGTQIFSKKEWAGLQLFMGENNNDGVLDPGEGAMCAACHVADWTAVADYTLPVIVPDWAPDGWVPPVFTDFSYDNLGVPKSEHRLLVGNPVDLGLGPIVGEPDENGKFKVMSLRNIHLTKPYAHNGYFKKLEEITHFYNTRDVVAEGWPAPEYGDTVNTDELGNLGLSDKDEDALVRFMKTLSDGWTP